MNPLKDVQWSFTVAARASAAAIRPTRKNHTRTLRFPALYAVAISLSVVTVDSSSPSLHSIGWSLSSSLSLVAMQEISLSVSAMISAMLSLYGVQTLKERDSCMVMSNRFEYGFSYN